MKLIALGGSAAGPNTGAGSAGFLVIHGVCQLVVDLGPDTLLELRKHVDYRDLTGVIISHYHLDHILDLGPLRYHLAYNPVPVERKIGLHVPPESLERFGLWARTFGHDDELHDFFSRYFEIGEYNPGVELTNCGVRITFAPTVHDTQGWAMRVTSDDGKSIGYTADTGPTAKLSGFFQGVDLLISEATERQVAQPDSATRGHMTAYEAGQLAHDSAAGILMLTHMWEEDGTDRAVGDARSRFDGPILVSRPGLTVYP